MTNIKILSGSVRPTRFNMQPATWLYDIAKNTDGIETELIDLKEVALPFLDEPNSPMQRDYKLDHTKDWSARIDAADGFVFVTPEYNHSYSPVLKNAIDYLFHEWHHKPVTFVSYGSLAGGTRAVEHLRGVSAELKLYDLREQIMLPNYWENLDENGAYEFTDAHETQAKEMLSALAFWAKHLKEGRELLAKQ